MNYDLFLSDFDGTLVRADGTVSEENKRAIAAYRAAGGRFIVCTGRMPAAILPRLAELGIEEGPVVAYQGATVIDVGTGEILKNDCFAREDALAAIRLLEAEGCHIHVYGADDFYCNMDDELLHVYEHICRVKGIVVNEKLSAFVEREGFPVVKVLAMTEPEGQAAFIARLTRTLGERFFVTRSAEWLVEIMPAGQSKAAAVQFLCEHFGISGEHIAAIGDQLNDLPMLLAAGGRFAVANAQEALKQAATVVPSNEEDGVAFALKYAMGETV